MVFLWVLVSIILIFGVVILVGAPYLPTLKAARKDALDLLDLKPGQVFVDLGSGDGAMLVAAARRNLIAIGYEINPILVVISKIRTLRHRRRVKVRMQNFWKTDISKVDGIFVFLIDHHMNRLDNFIKNQNNTKPIKVASHAFKIPGKKPVKKQGAVYLYKYQ